MKKARIYTLTVLLCLAVILVLTAVFTFSNTDNLTDIGATQNDIVAEAYTTGGTAISNASGLAAIRGSSGTYYLSANFTLGSTSSWNYNENNTFSGTLYGNGKTITINTPSGRKTTGDDKCLGFLVGYLSGTIQDLTINFNSDAYMYEYTGSSSNYTNYVGIICGCMNNGSVINNVTINVNKSISYYAEDTSSRKGGGYGIMLGAFCGQSNGGTIKNSTLNVVGAVYGKAEDFDGNNDEGTSTRAHVGGFIGEASGNTTYITDCKITGSGAIGAGALNSNGSHKCDRAGGVVGAVRSGKTLTVNGFLYDFNGFVAVTRSNSDCGVFCGRNYGTLNLNNIYKSTSCTGRAIQSNTNTRQVTGTGSISITTTLRNSTGSAISTADVGNASASVSNCRTYVPNNYLGTGSSSSSYGAFTITSISGGNFYYTMAVPSGYCQSAVCVSGTYTKLYTTLSTASYSSSFAKASTSIKGCVATYSSAITWGGSNKTYDGSGITVTARPSVNTGGTFNSGVYIYSTSNPTGANTSAANAASLATNARVGTYTLKLANSSGTTWTSSTWTYADNTSAPAKVNYYNGSTKAVTISQKNLSGNVTFGSISALTYNGAAQSPTTSVKDNARNANLSSGTDFTFSWSNNTNAGTGTLTATGKGNYKGTASTTFTINKKALTATVSAYNVNYRSYANPTTTGQSPEAGTGTAASPYTYYWSGLDTGVKFTISGIVTADNTSGVSFTLTDGTTVPSRYYKYTTAIGTTSANTQTLVNGNAFVACANGASDTQRTLTITTSNGNYSLSTVGAYKVIRRPVTVSFAESYGIRTAAYSYTYNASGQGVKITPSYHYAALTFGYAFSGAATNSGTTAIAVSGSSTYTQTNAGTYTLKVTSLSDTEHYALCTAVGSGSYTTGTPSQAFTINPRNLATYTSFAAVSAQTYNGYAITPTPTLSDSARGVNLSSSTEFTYSYSANVNAGTATITGTGKGNYTGTQTVTFTINPKDITGSTITTAATAAQTYTGAQIKPTPTVKDTARNANLVSGTDFTYSYGTNINVVASGSTDGSITVTGKNNYTGNYTVYFDISPKNVADSQVTIAAISAYTYNHVQFKPEPVVKFASASTLTLANGTDFTYSYGANFNAGTGTVTITGKGNYSGTKSASFTINPKAVSGATFQELFSMEYTGSQLTQLPVVTDYSETLALSSDYTVSYGANVNVLTGGTVTVAGINNYTGTKTLNLTITPKSISKSDMTINALAAEVYTGYQINPDVVINDASRGVILTVGASSSTTADIYLNRAAAINVVDGSSTEGAIGITAFNNYTGSTIIYFDIYPKEIGDASVVIADISAYTYDKVQYKPEPVVKDSARADAVLAKGTNFEYSYGANLAAGTGTVTITGKGNYQGTQTASFTINPKDIVVADAVDDVADQTYTGFKITPLTHLTDYSVDLVKDTDYVLTYPASNLIVTDTGTITVSGANNYCGAVTLYFTIVPKSITASDVKFIAIEDQTYIGAQITPPVSIYDETRGVYLTQSEDSDGTGDFYCYYGVNKIVGVEGGSVMSMGLNNYKDNTGYKFFDIVRRVLTVEFGNYQNLVYNKTTYTITANSGNYIDGEAAPTITLTYDAPALNAGTYRATARVDESVYTNYTLGKTAVYFDFEVAPKPLKVVYSDYSMIYNGAVRAVTVAFQNKAEILTGDTVYIVSDYGEGVTVKNAGDYHLDTTLSNANYVVTEGYDALDFTISQKPVSVAGKTFTKMFGSADPEFALTFESGTPDGSITVYGVRPDDGMTGEIVGNYVFSEIDATGAPNYEVTLTSDCTLKINKLGVTFTPKSYSKTYGDDDPELTMEVKTSAFDIVLAITFTREEGEDVRPKDYYDFVNYTFTAKNPVYQMYDNCFSLNVNSSSALLNKFIINKRTVEVVLPFQGKNYGDPDGEYIYIIDSNDIAPRDADIPVEELFQLEVTRIAGEDYIESGYTMYITLGNSNYNTPVSGDAIFMIYKRQINFTTDTAVTTEKIYDGTVAAATVLGETDLSTLLAMQARLSVNAVYDSADVASEKTVTVTYSLAQGMDVNFVVPDEFTLSGVINPKALVVSLEDISYDYGDDVPETTVTYDGFISGETAENAADFVAPTVNYNGMSNHSGAGNYASAITLEGGFARNYAVDITDTASVLVRQARLDVIEGDMYIRRADGTFLAELKENNYAYVGAKFDDAEGFVLFYSVRLQSASVGSTFAIMTIQGVNDTNYYVYNKVLYVSSILVAAPSISVTSDAVNYDGTPKEIVAEASIMGEPYTNIVVTYTSEDYPESTEPPVNAGEYTVKVFANEEDIKDNVITAKLVINKMRPVVTLTGEQTFVYGNFVPFTATIEFINETLDLTVTYDFEGDRPNAGTHTAIAAYAETQNYYEVSQTVGFSVSAIETSVKFSGYDNLIYNGKEQYPVATIVGAIEGDDPYAPVSVNGKNLPVNAGAYIAYVAAPSDNYILKGKTSIDFTIQKRKLVISVVNGKQIAAGTNPQLELSYEGFADGDSEEVLGSVPETIVVGGKVGENAVKLFGGSDANYDYVLDDADASVEVVYESPNNTDSTYTLYIVLGVVGGIALIVAAIAIINRKKISNEYINEHSRTVGRK